MFFLGSTQGLALFLGDKGEGDMKIKIIVVGKEVEDIAQGLMQGLKEGDHQVSLELPKELGTVMLFDKVIIGCAPKGFWKKKTPDYLQEILKKTKGLMGKKTIVFIKPGLIRNNLALRTLMNDVERLSGAFVENFAILKNKKEAQEFGQGLWG